MTNPRGILRGRGPDRWSTWIPAIAAVIASMSCLSFQPDDLFIYLRMVDNALAGAGWGFNPSSPVDAASSGLWLLVLTGLGGLGLVEPYWAQLASVAAWVLAIAGAARLAADLAGDRRAGWAAGLALAGDAWVGRWMWSGMETGLAVAVVCWAALLRCEKQRGSLLDRLGSLLLVLAPLVRPELALWTASAMVVELAGVRRHGWKRVRGDLLLGVLVAAGWAGWAWLTWGRLLPSTVTAKGSLGAGNIGMFSAVGRVVLVLASTQLPALLMALTALWTWAREPEGQSERAPGRRGVTQSILLLALLLTAVYAGRHVRVYTRYVLPLTALIVALGMARTVHLAGGFSSGRGHRLWGGVLALTLVGNLALSTLVVVPKTRSYARSMREVVFPLARRLGRITSPGEVIATPNIGAIGYLSRRTILDLNGLVTPEIVPYKREGRIADYLLAHPPALLVEIEPRPFTFEKTDLAPLLERLEVHRFEGMFVRGPDPMYLTVYRVSAPGAGSGEPRP